jgi:hypothetical protein
MGFNLAFKGLGPNDKSEGCYRLQYVLDGRSFVTELPGAGTCRSWHLTWSVIYCIEVVAFCLLTYFCQPVFLAHVWLVQLLLTCINNFSFVRPSLSPRRPGLDPRSVNVRFVNDKVALGQDCVQALRFSLSVGVCKCSILIHSPVTDAL